MAHQVFISYASENKSIADSVCRALEEAGVRCWIAPRDVPYAVDYEEAIVDAISESNLMLLVLSSQSNDSKHVKREVQNACREEPQVPVLPFLVEDITLNKSLKYYIGSVNWLSALTPPLEDHLQKLVHYVQARLSGFAAGEGTQTRQPLGIIEKPKVVERPAGQRTSMESEKSGQESVSSGSIQERYEDERAPRLSSSAVTPGPADLSGAQRLSTGIRETEEQRQSARQLTDNPATTEATETSRSWDARSKGMIVTCLVVLAALAYVWNFMTGGRLYLIAIEACAAVLVLAEVAFVLSVGSPSMAKRPRTLLIITGAFILAVLLLTWNGLLHVPGMSLQIVNILCISGLVVALFVFLSKTGLTPTAKVKTALFMAGPVFILFVALGLKPLLSRTPSHYENSVSQPSTNTRLTEVKPSAPLTAPESLARGDEFFKQQKYAEAEPYYRAAVRLEPANAVHNNNLGTALLAQQKNSEAEVYFQEAVRLQPKDAVMRNNLGNALYFQQRYASAEAQYYEATLLDSANKLYQENLRLARAAMGKAN